MNYRLVLLSMALLAGPAAAAESAGDRAERARIQAERAEVERAYALRQEECRQRFVVTSCLDAARRDRRDALELLRQQQVVLNDAQRKQRAAQRIDEIRAKVSNEEARRREAEARARAREKRQQDQAARVRAAAPAATPVTPAATPAPAPSKAPNAAAAAARASEYDKRQAEAKAHRAAVERRNAERAAKGKPARPLPVPSGASAP